MTNQEIKTYLILKYGSMADAIDFYIACNQTGTSDDYKLMLDYFHQLSKRFYLNNTVDNPK